MNFTQVLFLCYKNAKDFSGKSCQENVKTYSAKHIITVLQKVQPGLMLKFQHFLFSSTCSQAFDPTVCCLQGLVISVFLG